MEFLQQEEPTMSTSTTTSTTTNPISPLRQRMQHDMMMRGLGPHTQRDYIRHVRRLASFLGRPPDTATEEDLRRFQIHQHEAGASVPTINGAVSALRVLYLVKMRRRDRASSEERRSGKGGGQYGLIMVGAER